MPRYTTAHRLAACALLACVGAADARDHGTVRLKYGAFDPLAGEPAVPAALRMAAAGNLYIVQFHAVPDDALRRSLVAAGAAIERFLPERSYVIRTQNVGAVRAISAVRWVGAYHPAYRLDSTALADVLMGSGPARYSIQVMEAGPEQQDAIATRIRKLGGIVDLKTADGARLEATLDAGQLAAVAAMDEVNFIDPSGPIGRDMVIARSLSGATYLTGLGFSGQGVRGEVFDDAIDLAHPAFANPAPLLHGPNGTSPSLHGNQTFSIVFGNGAGNPDATGMLPGREQGIFASFQSFVGTSSELLELVDPSLPYRAVFQSRSVGSAQVTMYTTISAEIDNAIFQADILVTQSMSNTGNTSARPEAWAKNIVSVGGIAVHGTVDRSDDSAGTASFGPPADGRIKPDLANIDDGVLAAGQSPGYITSIGTSASSAITAGAAGLTFQLWHQGAWAGHGGGPSVFEDRPHAATARALLINGAYQYDWTASGPNRTLGRFMQGWGMPDIQSLYDSRARTLIVDQSDALTQGQVRSYSLTVAPGEPLLKATMVYADPAGNPAASIIRVNDLSLKLIAPDSTVYWGNNRLTASPWSAPGGVSDTINPVENVIIPSPTPGTWTVEVHGDAIVADTHPATPEIDADFALVVRGGSVPCYANCDGSTASPVLNVNDFICFQAAFAAADPYANCDGSTAPPILNINDFVCFQTRFAAGCP